MKNFHLINGVRDFTDCVDGWNDEGVDYINTHTSHHARSYHYSTLAVFHNLYKGGRVKKFLKLLKRYVKGENVVMAHSDGCDVTCRSLRYKIRLEAIHLFAAACDADFNKNGLNDAVNKNKVGRIFIYGSKDDEALQKASKAWWMRLIGQQYGNPPLGLVGPIHMSEKAKAITEVNMVDGVKHSRWLSPKLNLIESIIKVINS